MRLRIVIDERGHATGINVVSPLGFGLDERARATSEKWVFAPAEKDCRAVKVLANIEVNSQLLILNTSGASGRVLEGAVKLMRDPKESANLKPSKPTGVGTLKTQLAHK